MRRVIILGAAGRDFHNFDVFFRDNHEHQVVAFTAAQIPDCQRILPGRHPRKWAASGAQRPGVMHFRQAANSLYVPMAQLTMLLDLD